jgi:hypothetical protein
MDQVLVVPQKDAVIGAIGKSMNERLHSTIHYERPTCNATIFNGPVSRNKNCTSVQEAFLPGTLIHA